MFWSINKSVWMNEWQDRTEQNRTDSIMMIIIIIIMMIHFCHNSIFIIQTNKISTKIMHCMNYMLEISFLKCNNNNYKSSCHAHHRQRWLWKLNFGRCFLNVHTYVVNECVMHEIADTNCIVRMSDQNKGRPHGLGQRRKKSVKVIDTANNEKHCGQVEKIHQINLTN